MPCAPFPTLPRPAPRRASPREAASSPEESPSLRAHAINHPDPEIRAQPEPGQEYVRPTPRPAGPLHASHEASPNGVRGVAPDVRVGVIDAKLAVEPPRCDGARVHYWTRSLVRCLLRLASYVHLLQCVSVLLCLVAGQDRESQPVGRGGERAAVQESHPLVRLLRGDPAIRKLNFEALSLLKDSFSAHRSSWWANSTTARRSTTLLLHPNPH